jgi:protein-S-isoprenylcysteine O-methyltransferase Ste14
MRTLRWSNIPIPEGHVIPLVLGLALQIWFPLPLFGSPWLKQVLGWPLLLAGILLAGWAVVAIQDMDISRPSRLAVGGPYTFSRNPMYVAWTVIYVAAAVLQNSGWLLIFLPALVAFTHYAVVLREEQRLEQDFGEEYRRYRGRVRRY